MNNTIYTLIDLFKISTFEIPQYQRAYSWDVEPQLQAFLSDLRQQVKAQARNPEKAYFLGTVLLHETDKKVHVVDGQQRLTTSVLFVAASLSKQIELGLEFQGAISAKVLRRCFIFDPDEDLQKFRTIEEDNNFLRANILSINSARHSYTSPSAKRLENAFEYFLNSVDNTEWSALLTALTQARVMVYAVQNAADATQIFELQNDRGKKLSDLEALKSYLMHLIYLNAKNPDDRLKGIQTQFAKIFRTIEALGVYDRAPSEDAILSYHCAAWLKWGDAEWRDPKGHVRMTLAKLPEQNLVDSITIFVSELVSSFETVYQLFQKLDDISELSELVVQKRLAQFWPLLLKTWHADKSAMKSDFRKAVRLMEVYSFRGYGLSGLRSDAGQSSLLAWARDFTGDFTSLFNNLVQICFWFNQPIRFSTSLESSWLYTGNPRETTYLLWRYENHLRASQGTQFAKLNWKDFLSPSNSATRMSIEHIAAQDSPLSLLEVEWVPGDSKPFREIALHRLGNLVLDSISANASKGKDEYDDKLPKYTSSSTFLSQGELSRWSKIDSNGKPYWDVDSVRQRHQHLVDFAYKTWDPTAYHTVTEVTTNLDSTSISAVVADDIDSGD